MSEFDYNTQLPACPMCGRVPPSPPYGQGEKLEHRCMDKEGRLRAVVGPIFVELWSEAISGLDWGGEDA